MEGPILILGGPREENSKQTVRLKTSVS